MKKLLLLSLLVLAACSDNEDEEEQVCENRLWELAKVCDPPLSANCVYFATFGETEAASGTIQVTVETYDYYVSRGNVNDGSLCWEGPQD